MSEETEPAATQPSPKVGNFRWMICTLLFFAATVNYIDRQVIGILKPTLAGEYGWTEIDYSWIVFAFQTAYAIGLLFVGKLMDRIGTKKGFAIAAAAHQGWSANIFTLASDMFPKQAVGSVVGIGGMLGAVGGMIISPFVGWILDKTGSYFPIFIIAASAYLIALLVIHLLAPRLEPANINYE